MCAKPRKAERPVLISPLSDKMTTHRLSPALSQHPTFVPCISFLTRLSFHIAQTFSRELKPMGGMTDSERSAVVDARRLISGQLQAQDQAEQVRSFDPAETLGIFYCRIIRCVNE